MSARRNPEPSLESDEHFVRMAEWLALESQAELARMAERRKLMGSKNAEKFGESILDLAITDQDNGLGDRYLVTFARRNRSLPMPWHRLRVGSPVVVTRFPDDEETALQGVVSRRTSDTLQVAMKQWPDGKSFRIDLAADEITRQRQMKAIGVAKDSRGRLGQLRKILLGASPPKFGQTHNCEFQTELNESQQSAVHMALSAEDIAIIHGPPGTGKTTTVVELIVQAIAVGDRVLACAPTNTAVDNMLDRLIKLRQKVVRVGHPARVSELLRDHTLDGLFENSHERGIIRAMLREADELIRQAERFTRARPAKGEKAQLRREAKRLRAEARLFEKNTIRNFLDGADVVCSTTSVDENLLGERRFDLVVIDEACQCTEPACWIPLLRCNRLVLAGDPCQLPPTILSREAAREGFEISMMERLTGIMEEPATQLLQTQYRMHQQIMKFSSVQFYDDQLEADATVNSHLLSEICNVATNEMTSSVITFIDTAGAAWDEQQETDGLSRCNPMEAELILNKARQLVDAGLDPREIAIIAPYAAQVRLLRSENEIAGLEIDTVDGFQGREKEAVLITLVRSNQTAEVGFLAEVRRMNVAITRARRRLIMVGDSATIGGHPFYRTLLEYVESIGGYKSVWQEVDF